MREHEVDEEAAERVHLDARKSGDATLDQLHPLRDAEEGSLPFVLQHRDEDAVEEMRPATNDVEMTIRERIERAGVDGGAHGEMVTEGLRTWDRGLSSHRHERCCGQRLDDRAA